VSAAQWGVDLMTPLCKGPACDAIAVTWDPEGEQYVVENKSDRSVAVNFKSWPRDTRIKVDPRETVFVALTGFEHPYLATYLS